MYNRSFNYFTYFDIISPVFIKWFWYIQDRYFYCYAKYEVCYAKYQVVKNAFFLIILWLERGTSFAGLSQLPMKVSCIVVWHGLSIIPSMYIAVYYRLCLVHDTGYRTCSSLLSNLRIYITMKFPEGAYFAWHHSNWPKRSLGIKVSINQCQIQSLSMTG